MKENQIQTSDLIYHWTFNDNQSVVDNPRVKSVVQGNPIFNNGVATFNGSTDYYKLKTLVNLGTKYSVEVKFKLNNIVPAYIPILTKDGSTYPMYLFNGNRIYHGAGNSAYIEFVRDTNWHTYTITRTGNSGKMYLDAIDKTITGSFSATANMIINTISSLEDASIKASVSIEYIKIWNRQLTASEVKNNVNGKTYRALPYVSEEILGSELITNQTDRDFSSDTGFWSKSAQVSIHDNICTIASNDGSLQSCSKSLLTIGKYYKVTYTIVANRNGSLKTGSGFGGGGGAIPSTVGTYTAYFPATQTVLEFIRNSGVTDIDIDNISIKEVTQSAKNTLFHINSDNGVIRDLTGKTSPIATNVNLVKIGSNRSVMKFDGLSGNINLGTQALLVDITFMGWVNLTTFGKSSQGMICNNGKYLIRGSSSGVYYLVRDATVVTSGANTVKLSNTQFLCITSTSTGITNIYIGNKNTPPTLSGTANQSAGTPVAGTTCYLGNRAGDDRTMNGWIGDARMDSSILLLDEITNFWSNTRGGY